jgi:hypothetical protein
MAANESTPAEGDRSGGTVGEREAVAYLLLAHRFAVLRDSVTDTLDQAARAAETGEFTEYHVGQLRTAAVNLEEIAEIGALLAPEAEPAEHAQAVENLKTEGSEGDSIR